MNFHANDCEEVPILAQKHYTTPSVFTPENLLREARRQKELSHDTIPAAVFLTLMTIWNRHGHGKQVSRHNEQKSITSAEVLHPKTCSALQSDVAVVLKEDISRHSLPA